jgi:hypothetical protein
MPDAALTPDQAATLLGLAHGDRSAAEGDPAPLYRQLEAAGMVEIVRFYGGYRVQLTRAGVRAVHDLRGTPAVDP